jgi:hypothetical protein
MRWSLGVISGILLLGYPSYSQNTSKETYEAQGIRIEVEKQELLKLTEGCDGFLNVLTVKRRGNRVFTERICSVDSGDVVFVRKGYLTIVEHYSSPVGWSKYYIVDLCQGRLIITREIEEGTEIDWEKFIDLDGSVKPYIEEVKKF